MTESDSEAVLVLSTHKDATADAVVAELDKLDTPVVRMDIGDFPTRMRIAAANDGGRWRGRLWTETDMVDLDCVRAVYYRRPTRFGMPPGLSSADSAFATTEARLGFGGVLSALLTIWVNHPARIAEAEYKPRQLRVAAEAGLVVPRTLISNDVDELRAFSATVAGPVVCKTFSSLIFGHGDTSESVYTTIIDPAQVDPEQFAVTAHLVQEWIPKEFEARVTMVADVPFAAAIHANSADAHVDWRADYQSLRHERIDVPPDVTTGMRHYLRRFGLNFGAFDFVVEPTGRWRFLECNPNGQWLWLEHDVGLPIAAALAHLLGDGGTS